MNKKEMRGKSRKKLLAIVMAASLAIQGTKPLLVYAALVVLYCVLSYMPAIAAVSCIVGVIIFTALFRVLADYIGNDVVRIIVNVAIAAFFGFLELALFANATLSWLDRKNPKKPRVRRIEE